jgi:hypothetical protein
MAIPFEIYTRYKQETAERPCSEASFSARIGRWGDLIVDGSELPDWFKMDVQKEGVLNIPDPDYVNWLENKFMEALKNAK